MTAIMTPAHGSSLETRPSLLNRLKSDDDPQSWQEFYKIYGGLIRFFAVKAGLTEDEAEEVVQETAIGVARRLPEFTYDPKRCRFKTWLLNLVRWRIQDQIRRRRPHHRNAALASVVGGASSPRPHEDSSTATVERIADPTVPEFGAEWDAAWEQNLWDKAIERTRERTEERQFQVFDLCVRKNWPAADVARTLGISTARVHLTKHRVSVLLKKEIRRLEKVAVQSLRVPAED